MSRLVVTLNLLTIIIMNSCFVFILSSFSPFYFLFKIIFWILLKLLILQSLYIYTYTSSWVENSTDLNFWWHDPLQQPKADQSIDMLSLGVSPRSSPCTKVPVGFQIFYQSITALSLNTALNPTICGQSQISLPEHYCCFILFSNGERLLNKLYIFTRTWLGLKEWPRVKSGIKWSQCTCWVAMVSIFSRKKSKVK